MSNNNDFFQSIKNENQNITKIRDYIIIKRIGFGSSGLVYQVYNNNDPYKTILILKQIPFRNISNNFEETTRKLKEAKNESLILSKLSYKYVVKYYDSFIEDDCINIIMEFCEEGDFGTFIINLIQKNNYLSEQQIWHFFIQISLGLAYIHSKNILHRDLKPMNIFLKKNNLIKIGDLGVAKMLQTNTKAITYIGTPYYLSPEVCEGKPYNSKSDVWALGCILYELCTLKKPFNAFNQAALCMKIIEGKFTPLSKVQSAPKYSKNLEKLINSMLKRDYMERPLMKEIINNKIFFEKAVNLGYGNDIKEIYNNFSNINLRNNIVIKNIEINSNINMDKNNLNDQNSNRESQNEKKRTIPTKSRESKEKRNKRVHSSGICKNKKRNPIHNNINNLSKLSKNSSYKSSCKKTKSQYKIYPSGKEKCKSTGKNTIDTSHNYNRHYSMHREKDINTLTTLNNYDNNKRKYIIPRNNSKKIIIRNNIISNLKEKPKLIKCNSNFNNISSFNNNKKDFFKERASNKYIEEKEIIKYICPNKLINKSNNDNLNIKYNFQKELPIKKININGNENGKEYINYNNLNYKNNNNLIANNNLGIQKNIQKINNINRSGIKIIGIDKKYENKSSINNSKNKIRKKINLNKHNNKMNKIDRGNKIIQEKESMNEHKSSDNLFRKHKKNIKIENNNNGNLNLNGTQIKLHKKIPCENNLLEKYSSPYIKKELYINNKVYTDDNYINTDDNSMKNNINTDDNSIKNNINNKFFEINNSNYNINENRNKIYDEKPKMEGLFTITKNTTSEKTNNDILNDSEHYNNNYNDGDINVTKTEEDNDNDEKVSVLKEKNNDIKEEINKQKEEYCLKYNEYKNNILKYKNIIDIEKLFSLYELISKDKEKNEDITKDIENYLITNLPKNIYKQFHKLFNNFIFYDIEIGNINRLQQKFS